MISFKRTCLIIVALLAMCLVGCGVIVTPEAPPTPTPFVMQSLFEGDTCAPPCWFGLTAGVSTSEEAAEFLLNSEYVDAFPAGYQGDFMTGDIDPDTGYLMEGYYRFSFSSVDTDFTRPAQGYNRLYVREGIVDFIRVSMREYVTVSEVLEVFGQPDQIRFEQGFSSFALDFIYLEPRIRLSIGSVDEIDDGIVCSVALLEEHFLVETIRYFSPQAAIEPTTLLRADIDGDQPALVAYAPNTRYVPLETWNSWVDGEVNRTCLEEWRSLSREVILPTMMPTLLITPTATP